MTIMDIIIKFMLFIIICFWFTGMHIPILHSRYIINLISYRYVIYDKHQYPTPPVWKTIVVLLYCGPLLLFVSIVHRIVSFIKNSKLEDYIIEFLEYEIRKDNNGKDWD